jgi:hypothetical protein
MDRNELAEWLEWLVQDEFHNLSAPKMERLRQAAAALRESEEWRRDAERYRWLRERPWQTCHTIFPNAPWIHEGHEGNQLRMDAAIDAARKEGV